MGTRIKSQKIVEIKGTCTLREQGNIVKYLWGTNEQKKRFQGNTGTPNTPPPPLQETLRYKDNHRNMLDVISIDEKRWWKLKDEMISEGY